MKNGGLWLSRECEAHVSKEASCTPSLVTLSISVWNPALEEVVEDSLLKIKFILQCKLLIFYLVGFHILDFLKWGKMDGNKLEIAYRI